MRLGVMGNILEDQFMSQGEQLLKSWRNRPVDASLFFWREIHFFVPTQMPPCSLQKSLEDEKGDPRGTAHESNRQPSIAAPQKTPSAFLHCILTGETPSLSLNVYHDFCLFGDPCCFVVEKSRSYREEPRILHFCN